MRLFLYIFYFIRSLYYRGLPKTMRLLMAENRYEKKFKIRTLQIKASADPENFHYQGASYYILLEVLKKLPENTKHKKFIDYGCGKGRALFCAEYSGFNYLLGVELDKELLETAEQNLKSYSGKRPESQFTFVNQNAIDFEIPAGTQVFYFFNPFGETVMKKVAENIARYRKTSDDTLYVVYLNPKFRSLWLDFGFQIFYTEGNRRYTEAIIYKL